MNDQRSLKDQLDSLDKLAAKHGLYDAQDWLRRARETPRREGSERRTVCTLIKGQKCVPAWANENGAFQHGGDWWRAL